MRFMTMVTVQERLPHFSKNNLKGGLRGVATSRKHVAYWLAFAEHLGLCEEPSSLLDVHCMAKQTQCMNMRKNGVQMGTEQNETDWTRMGLNGLPVLRLFNFRSF